MNLQILLRHLILPVVPLLIAGSVLQAQETIDQTIPVHGRQDFSMYTGGAFLFWDEFTIVSSPGITWLRVIEGSVVANVWEKSSRVLYDDVPVARVTTKCVKRPPPCEGCSWQGATTLSIVALGEGTLTLRFKKMGPEPPFPVEGEYLDQKDMGSFADQSGEITASPNSLQPGNTTNIRITIPSRMRLHVSGVTVQLPKPPDASPNLVTLPFDIDGVYDFSWTVPAEPYFEKLNATTPMQIGFSASSNRRNSMGQFYTITEGVTFVTLSSTLHVDLSVQGIAAPSGQSFTWIPNRERLVNGSIREGKGPFTSKWIVNGKEVKVPGEYELPESRDRTLKDQNVLENAGTITFEVTDANGNRASGTVYTSIKTGMDFELSVQGKTVSSGSTVNWNTSSSRLVTARQTVSGELPYRTRWLIDGTEVISSTSRMAHYQITQQDLPEKASRITFEVTDANEVKKTYTIHIGNPAANEDESDQPAGPVGPAPVPPPAGNQTREPNPNIDWNGRPWMDAQVILCTREYLQRIVLPFENEYVRWENTGLPVPRQKLTFTSIDDWGRLLNQQITASGGVDGSWDNSTHYVWSVYNKPEAGTRYGRTVDDYCKYECAALEPKPDDLNAAIRDVSDDPENIPWDEKKVQQALDHLNNLLELARNLYSRFNQNHLKFVNEINDQKSDPLRNELLALCLASAQNQLTEHTVTKDTLDVAGNLLIAQSSTHKNVDMLAIIRMLSEVQVESDDMNRKMDEMKVLLASRGGDYDEIIHAGQTLIAQGNINPEFAQDGGVNVEFFGDGVDNFGDGLQDFMYGNVRKGNVLVVVWDAGNVADDIFGVFVTGLGELGNTPPGGRRNFDITLAPGTYTLTVTGIYTDPNSPPCTFGIQVYDQNNLIIQEVNLLETGERMSYTITLQ